MLDEELTRRRLEGFHRGKVVHQHFNSMVWYMPRCDWAWVLQAIRGRWEETDAREQLIGWISQRVVFGGLDAAVS